MDDLIIESTEKSPKVHFGAFTGHFQIIGNSIPEDCLAFYKPIFSWLDQYLEKPALSTKLRVELQFFNTSTSKCLFNIFKKLEQVHRKGNLVEIKWCYILADSDMYESGLDYSNMLKVPFKFERVG